MYDLVNFSNSILKNYDIETFHETIPELDKLLSGHKKIVIMLFDGMGKNIIEKHLKKDSTIRSNYSLTINSTFPPTTAAATTAVLSGKYPVETGWIAWDAYFKELDKNVILFKNVDYNTNENIDNNYVRDALKYESIVDLINKKDPANNACLIQRYPILENGPKNLRQSKNMLNKYLKNKEKAFVYFYYDSPDYEMHENGIDGKLINKACNKIDEFVKKVAKKNKDTLFITFADHGHINVKYLDIAVYPKLTAMLRGPIGGEKRSTQFFVKKEYLNTFKEMFKDLYGHHFDLISKEEMIDSHLYGIGNPHPLFNDMLGDYIAISKDEYSLISTTDFKEVEMLKGHHAGGTSEEKLIDISVINN